MSDSGDRPTASTIEKESLHLTQLWAPSKVRWNTYDEYVNQTYAVWDATHGDRPKWHLSMASSIIDTAVSTQLALNPSASRDSVSRGEKKSEADDEIETWTTNRLNAIAAFSVQLPAKQLARHLVTYGYGVLKGPLLDFSDEPEDPEKMKKRRSETTEDFEHRQLQNKHAREDWFPFRTEAPHPARILLDPTEKRPTAGLEVTGRYRIDLHKTTLRRAEHFEGVKIYPFQDGDDPFQVIPTIERWSMDFHALMASGEGDSNGLLFVENNTHGFVPYKHGFAGFGGEPTEFEKVDPKFLAKGLLESSLETIRRESQRISSQHNLLMMAAWSPLVLEGHTADEIREMMRGDVIPVKPGELEYLKTPEVKEWWFRMGDEVAREIELATGTRDLGGQRQAGVDTVGQQLILRSASLSKFSALGAQMDHMFTQEAQDALRLVDNVLKRKVRVGGAEIGPQDIGGNYTVEVKFERIDPVLQIQEAELAMRQLAAGLIDVETALAKSGYEDITAIRKGKMKDAIRAMPEVQKRLTLDALREDNLGELADELENMTPEEVQIALGAIPQGNERSLADLLPRSPDGT